ncbi:TrmJ/YjtD family RNA methyltransferase [Parerythrobacter lacustris]|uniref:tRNA (cytidine/uridine-2'-O-)-methyltransferase TrmJ n=1 Tax=Parerythrobacter lacustris TaxID=2969984 RepID=A0ABT1XTG6_9SPHN|nr:TrmJ/YjtD family RNA methyltransferase [Parerythrobacter lacustris]MCR2833955.1 TrmJ/YjtD family RNA methyltransferase [Parerythrobacter lacustris]
MAFWTYMLRCADGSYFLGHTDELDDRIAQHQSGALGGYTATRLPVELVWSDPFETREEAFDAERKIKGWSRAKKEALVRGDWAAIQRLSKRGVLRDARTDVLAPQDERARDARTDVLAPQDERARDARSDVRAPRDERALSTPAHPEEPKSQSEASRRKVSAHPHPAHPEEPKTQSEASRRTDPPNDRKPIIILVRPQLGENIGKTARAMLNFGLTELRIVNPRDGWPNPDAGPSASGADIVLDRAQVFATTADAVADCSHIYATTVRKRGVTKPVVTPEQAARDIVTAQGRSAILFGAERSGLETEDVALARAVLTVPVNPEFSSLNLAQAVILCAYEWSKTQVGSGDLVQPTEEDLLPPAPQAELEGLVAHFERLLEPKGYFFPEDRAEASRRTLRNVLTKPGWNHLEVRTLRGVLSSLDRSTRRGN